jgi:hypothetical protein
MVTAPTPRQAGERSRHRATIQFVHRQAEGGVNPVLTPQWLSIHGRDSRKILRDYWLREPLVCIVEKSAAAALTCSVVT